MCQEASVNPVRLPCQHIFCYLCIKGVAARSGRCALCRERIPPGYLDKPTVMNKEEIKSKLEQSTDSYHWFYEAKNGGWWMYEERASSEIEKAYTNNEKNLRIQISGFFYKVDFEEMVQYREDIPSRRRKIKRDLVQTESVKGVAGIYVRDGSGPISREEDGARARGSRPSSGVGGPSSSSDSATTDHSELVTGLD